MSTEPIPILMFTKTRARYGAEEHMLTLLRMLPRNSFRLHLVCPPELAEQFRPDLPGDVELQSLPLRSATRVADALRFAAILRQRRIAILHSHMSFSGRFASPIGRASGVRVILETPHVAENWRRGLLKTSFWVDRFFGTNVDHYIAVSEANGRYLVEQKRLPASKVAVIRNGCDLDRFVLPSGLRPALRKKFGFQETDLILTVPARLEPQKGHCILLEALADIRKEFPNLRVVCLGDGSLRERLEQMAAALGLAGTVHFCGFQNNIAEWFALSNFTVLPSLYEGLPLVAIESLAASRPLVATSVDGTPEVVINGVTGLTVPPGDSSALALAIGKLLRNPSLVEKYGRQGREWVKQEFSQERQVQRTAELYLRAWKQKQPTVQPEAGDAAVEWQDVG